MQTNRTARLVLLGTASVAIALTAAGEVLLRNNSVEGRSGGLARLLLNPQGGAVGIGTTIPVTTLDVRGNGIALHNTTNALRWDAGIAGTGAGFTRTYGANGIPATSIGTQPGAASAGIMGVLSLDGTNFAGYLAINHTNGESSVSADVKNFRVPNPRDPETDIVYACIEGPEAAAYVRGTAQLHNGRASILLPQHFADVISGSQMTVQLTPLSETSRGLAVVAKTADQVDVTELAGGSGNYEFDYFVAGVRAGKEGYRVIRPIVERSAPQPAEEVMNEEIATDTVGR
jgi:hypothetical protein